MNMTITLNPTFKDFRTAHENLNIWRTFWTCLVIASLIFITPYLPDNFFVFSLVCLSSGLFTLIDKYQMPIYKKDGKIIFGLFNLGFCKMTMDMECIDNDDEE